MNMNKILEISNKARKLRNELSLPTSYTYPVHLKHDAEELYQQAHQLMCTIAGITGAMEMASSKSEKAIAFDFIKEKLKDWV